MVGWSFPKHQLDPARADALMPFPTLQLAEPSAVLSLRAAPGTSAVLLVMMLKPPPSLHAAATCAVPSNGCGNRLLPWSRCLGCCLVLDFGCEDCLSLIPAWYWASSLVSEG